MPINWATTVLATDADLRAQDSRMPELAQQTPSRGGTYAYSGKRALAKRDIEAYLRRRNIDPNFLKDPTQLNRAAVFRELEYIYRDLAHRGDTVSGEKAAYYLDRYNDEMENVYLDYEEPTTTTAPTAKPGIPLRRG